MTMHKKQHTKKIKNHIGLIFLTVMVRVRQVQYIKINNLNEINLKNRIRIVNFKDYPLGKNKIQKFLRNKNQKITIYKV